MLYNPTARSGRTAPSLIDLVLIIMSVVSFGYFITDYQNLVHRVGFYTDMDFFMALLATIVCFEATRRVMGWMLPIVGCLFLLYAVYGDLLPHSISHRGYPWPRVLTAMFSQEGMFGMVLEVTAAYVLLFVIFGAMMNRFGAGEFFIRLPFALTAGYRGGPAKASVLGSGMMGMISGSATANTVATGTFTIPLMIKAGYPRHVAGAIEPAASTGGMFMPPIMGAAVFIMAEIIRMPYTQIMIVAFVPAILYFLSVAAMAHFEALRDNIPIIPRSERESPWVIFREGWFYLLPIVAVIYLMLSGMSPARSVFFTLIFLILIGSAARVLKKPSEISYKSVAISIVRDLIGGLEDGARNALGISAIVGVVGIILGVVFLTGLGFIFTTSIMQFTFGLIPLGILLGLVASYILGMGMTVTSAYILMAILVAPGLEALGISALAAHMIVFWYSQSSNISPPVCMAAFAGASIAKSDPIKTGFTALRFSVFLFIIPVLFVYTPILMPDGFNAEVAHVMASSFIAVITAAAALSRYFIRRTTLLEIFLLITASCLLLFPQILVSFTGFLVVIVVWIIQKRRIEMVASTA
nr:TRAP transporter fused permease subunit [Halomonas socia]